MTGFAALQSEFQRAILSGDKEILAEILDSKKETRDVLFDVYRNAYALRLVEALTNSYELLHRYVGDEMFDELGRAYIARWPSHHPNMRWFGHKLPRFLAEAKPYSDYPILTEVAALENALSDAFDAPDGELLAMDVLSSIDPSVWHDLVFAPNASVRRFDFKTNALEIWTKLRDEEEVPEAAIGEASTCVIVWRQDATAMVRSLGTEEAMMWDEAAKGIPFGQLCMTLATYDDPDNAATRAAGYLGQWVTSGMLASAVVG